MKENDKVGTRKEYVITLNKKGRHDYEILNTYEAGIVLTGTEVKSLRDHKASIQEAYARIKGGEVWMVSSNIPIYKHGNIANHDPLRERKLLLSKSEIRKIDQKLKEKGLTLIPLKLFFSGPFIKVEIGLAKGKKLYDKRETIRKEESKRHLKRIRI
ncbi:MAG TPA: SsrA-binding protein SmpB [Ignavibacteria bacterium]|nr:SsrA-binding protein SmpB [Ignavibacteria bacterium]